MKELIIPRILCLLIGYLSGNFMTAEFVTRKLTGRDDRQSRHGKRDGEPRF